VVTNKKRRSKHERATMKIKDKIDQNREDHRVSHTMHRGEPPPLPTKFWLNSICIHLRVRGSYIYMYRRNEIYKKP
jgi:hypothetical protein